MKVPCELSDSYAGHFQSFYWQIHFNETLGIERRSSSAWSYLYPESQQRAKLTVLTEHMADKIVTKAGVKGVTATGVMVLPTVGGKTMVFSATKEVVVSAGALFVSSNCTEVGEKHLYCVLVSGRITTKWNWRDKVSVLLSG